jgi:hypothetical protein
MFQELDTVIPRQDLPDRALKAGDAGTVVFVHNGGQAYEVEFIALSGETIVVETLAGDALRPASFDEIAHVRKVKESA